MRRQRHIPKVNAGSMADIAFLLLIFFLVTTTIASDKGLNRKLPKLCPPGQDCSVDINERNILRIALNNKHEIMVDDDIVDLSKLKNTIKAFVDNNGDDSCSYCNGNKIATLSDNPKAAVISLKSSPQASYEMFIEIQDELTKAYYELRITYAENVLKKSIEDLTKEETKLLKQVYPFVVSEALTK